MLGAHEKPLSKTPDDLIQDDLATVRVRNPDAHICFGPQGWPMPNGPADGQVAIFCYQSSPDQGQPSYQSAELYIEAVNSDASVEYFVSLWMPNAPDGDAVNAFVKEAEPIIKTVVWHPKALPSDALPSYTPFSLPPPQAFCLPTLNGAPVLCVP
jgi:hypothetical protein